MSLADLRDNNEDELSLSDDHSLQLNNQNEIHEHEHEQEHEHECLICKELLCEPITLLCQHSYCMECIATHYNRKFSEDNQNVIIGVAYLGNMREGYNKCPACQFPFTLPPKYNNNLEHLLSQLYPQEYESRKESIKQRAQQKELQKKMRLEVWNMMCSDTPNQKDDPVAWGNRTYTYPYKNLCLDDQDDQRVTERKGLLSSIWSLTKSIFEHPLVFIPFAICSAAYFQKKINN
ncbi:MAG: hypothetical protein JSR17_00965 [Proteobacteria bacterium]|nr:hypothetical protein [Pseudomonadota bacterium]